jgi:outer membrane autotransporter protein
VASSRVGRTVAQYLDRITPSATGDLGEVIGTFQLLDESEFGEAFASLSPGLYDNSTRTMYDATRRYTTTLLKRIHSVQLMSAQAVSQNKTISGVEENLLAYNGSAASIGRLYAPAQQKLPKKYGLWIDGFGQWGDRDEDDGFTGYDYTVHGVTLGIDRMIRDRYIAGISIGYSDTDVDVDRDEGDGDIDTLYGSLYGSYYTGKGYIDAALSYGNQDYYNKRRVVIGPIEREARSDHDGDMFSAFAEGGYTIDVNAWALQPFASLHYLNLDEEGFAEKGADSVNLIISARETESLVSELGLRFTRLYEVEKGTLIPEVSLAWSYDFDIDDRMITTALAGAPDSAFSIKGQHVEKQGLTIGAGITFLNKGGFTTSVKYNGEFRDSYGAHGIIGELRYEF